MSSEIPARYYGFRTVTGQNRLGLGYLGQGRTDEEQATLRALNLARMRARAQTLGLPDVEGTGAQGFLTGALDYLSRPGSAVLGALTSGQAAAGEPADPLSRFVAGLTGEQQFRGSDIVGETPEGASILDRVLRGGTGFAIDVATDPLTYLTLGRGGVLRGAGAARATQAQVRRAAREFIPPKAGPTPTAPVALGSSTEAAMARAKGPIDLLTERPVVPMGGARGRATLTREPVSPVEAAAKAPVPEVPSFAARRRGEDIFPGEARAATVERPSIAPEAPPVDDFVDRVASAAAEGQIIGGGRGARDAIQRVLSERYSPDEAARLTRSILSRTTGEVRGGIGVRAPFLGRSAEGAIVPGREAATRRLVDLTPGAGYATDALGLRSFAEASRKVFNQYRSTSVYQNWSKLMNGRFGQEYASVIRNSTGKGGMTYDEFSKIVGADKRMLSGLQARDEAAGLLLVTAKNMLDRAPSPEDAKRAAEEYLQMGDNMVLAAGANESERVGFEVASSLRLHGENMFDELLSEAERAGVEVGNLRTLADNYVPRPLSGEEIARRKAAGVDATAYSAQDPRSFGFVVDPNTGKARSLSAAEMNQRLGRKVFETDPLKVASQQYASYSEFIGKLSLVGDLKKTGLLTEITPDLVKLPNMKKLLKRLDKFNVRYASIDDAIRSYLDVAQQSGDFAAVQLANDALSELATSRQTIDSVLSGISDTDPESLRAVGTLVKTMSSVLSTGEKFGVILTAKQKEKLLSKSGLVRQKATSQEAMDAIARGLAPIGGGEIDVRLPRGMSNMYASESVRDAVEKYFKVNTKGSSVVRKFFDNVYRPYYTLFKTYATIGRPGGYHVRNLIGGMWNNYLSDVAGADHTLAASVLKSAADTKATAKSAVDNVLAGKASGLSGDEDKLANYVADLARSRGTTVTDYEVDQLADFLLMNKLSKVKIGDTNLAEVYISAADNGVLRSKRALNEIRMEARAEGDTLSDALLDPDFINLFRGSRAELSRVQNALNRTANWSLLRRSAQASDISENFLRLAAFISGARRFGIEDGGEAANWLVKGTHFDYQDLSDFERQVLKNIIPFYVWTRRNVPLQFWSLMNQPGKFNKLEFAQDELQNQFGAEGDTEGMNQIVPEWMRNKMGFVSMFEGPSGAPIAIGLESPALDLNRYLAFGAPTQAAEATWKEAVSASNPLFKALVEATTGVDTFTGAPISDKGEPVPFMVPGVGFRTAEGEAAVPSQFVNIASDLLPPVGIVNRLTGRGTQGERIVTNYLSQFLGAPVSTLTPRQVTGEIRSREERLSRNIEREINDLAYQFNVDREWLKNAIFEGASMESIVRSVESGLAPRPVAE